MTIETLQAKYEMTVREATVFMDWNAGHEIMESQTDALLRALNKFRKVSL